MMRIATGLLMLLASAGSLAAGGVQFPTRVLYQQSAGSKGATLTVTNQADKAYLLQSQVLESDTGNKTAPFMVIPPLKKVDANQSAVLTVLRTGGKLPQDRESVLWLSVRLIPQSSDDKPVSRMQLNLISDYRIKVFYRPAGIKNDKGVASAVLKLTASRAGSRVVLHNPTPYYITPAQLKAAGKEIDTAFKMVPPFGQADYPLPAVFHGGNISLRAFDESGFATPVRQIEVR